MIVKICEIALCTRATPGSSLVYHKAGNSILKSVLQLNWNIFGDSALPDGAGTIVEAEKLLLRGWWEGVGDFAVCGLGTLDHPSDPLPGPRGCWILTKTLEAGRRAGDQHCKEVRDNLTFDCSTKTH